MDLYFCAFEHIATPDVWPFLFHSKAQEVGSVLSLEDSLIYDTVMTAILHAYELVPEAYLQKFRAHCKSPAQTM